MALNLLDLRARHELVCSDDPSVTLKLLPPDPKAPAGNEPQREPRNPVRWLPAQDVELVGTEATRVWVRLLDDDEQTEVTGGLQGFRSPSLGPMRQKALKLGLTGARAPGVDAITQQEVDAFRKRLPLRWREMLGDWIIDASCGFSDPFGSRG